MNKRQITISLVFVLALLAVTVLAACGSSTASTTPTPPSSGTIDAQALLTQDCSHCHPLTRVTSKTKTASEWKTTVDRMIKHGARLTPQQEQAIIDYLAQNY